MKQNIAINNYTVETVYDRCTACRVCEKICPVQCIRIIEDRDGFLYPSISAEKCISCGLCLKSCHLTKAASSSPDVEIGRYGYAKEETWRREGSSGGGFSSIVEYVARKAHKTPLFVFGSVFDKKEQTVHQQGYLYPNYKSLCQSKYVFSDPRNTFVEVKKHLEEGAMVVYCGTPCQIGALRQYIGRDTSDMLITIDFICHGVPSAGFLKQHIRYIAKGKTVENVEFRSKAMGWRMHCLKVTKENGTYLRKAGRDFYFAHFTMNDSLRSACYDCHYSRANVSDLTLGDFWEKSRYIEEESDEKGVSVIFANTELGKRLLDELDETMILSELPEGYRRSKCGGNQKQHEQQKVFLKRLREKGITHMERKFVVERPLRILRRLIRIAK